ncbi:cytochrome c1 [Thaumasiovibrio sp. DFM-14]|uniref:cytochrome c1 n=1 Tax=Thaumasiovibrio sp. DFM-14 TaxID=3384792 RepID=UPI0039A2286C
MKKWILVMFALLPGFVLAAGGGNVHLDSANNDLRDKASLQSGAMLFMNYCFGCHSTQYQRYGRVAEDLGIPADLMKQNLIFDAQAKIGDLMENAMADNDAKKWFGNPAPDLTMVSRVRGTDWVYTYLRSFYVDPSRPFGVNNTVFPSVGMPHALEELQGTPYRIYEERLVDGEMIKEYAGIETDGRGELSATEFDIAVRDLVNFLEYSAEPVKIERQRLGYWVMGFLVLFFIITLLLKKEYWRDVH